MKAVYSATDELISELTNAEFNTVTFGAINDVDIEKQNLYPLANIELENVILRSSTAQVTFSVILADIVDADSLQEGLKQRTDNLLDIYHDLATRFNLAWQRYLRNPNVQHIEISQLQMESFNMRFENKLAGYDFDFTITIPNNQESSC